MIKVLLKDLPQSFWKAQAKETFARICRATLLNSKDAKPSCILDPDLYISLNQIILDFNVKMRKY